MWINDKYKYVDQVAASITSDETTLHWFYQQCNVNVIPAQSNSMPRPSNKNWQDLCRLYNLQTGVMFWNVKNIFQHATFPKGFQPSTECLPLRTATVEINPISIPESSRFSVGTYAIHCTICHLILTAVGTNKCIRQQLRRIFLLWTHLIRKS